MKNNAVFCWKKPLTEDSEEFCFVKREQWKKGEKYGKIRNKKEMDNRGRAEVMESDRGLQRI